MNVEVVKIRELSTTQLQRWSEIQRSDRSFASPFFCPEFAIAAGSVMHGVQVAIIEEGGTTVGFFPFQRHWPGVCRPVADLMSDYHGVVILKDMQWDQLDLLRACGISSFEFNHLIAAQEPFRPYHHECAISPMVDLRDGFEAYRRSRVDAGSALFKQVEGLARQCAREVGPVRFEHSVVDPAILDHLIDLKLQNLLSKGKLNAIQVGWTRSFQRRFLRRILETRHEGFAGMLSVLFVNNEVAAAHMGMRSHIAWHWWITSYDKRFHKYSPSLILLMRMVQTAPGLGLACVDLGKGESAYKQRFMNGSTLLAKGEVVVPCFASRVRILLRKAKALVDRTPLQRPALAVYHSIAYRTRRSETSSGLRD